MLRAGVIEMSNSMRDSEETSEFRLARGIESNHEIASFLTAPSIDRAEYC